jgi:hypothetical protein
MPHEIGGLIMHTLLTDEVVIALSHVKKSDVPVMLAAVDGNWGAPVSGRADTDFLNIWVIAKADSSGKVYVYGARSGNWNISAAMTYQEDLGDGYGLFKFTALSQYQFPDEFIIRFDINSNESAYDNNNAANYKITAYHGYFASVRVSGKYIIDLGDIRAVNPEEYKELAGTSKTKKKA